MPRASVPSASAGFQLSLLIRQFCLTYRSLAVGSGPRATPHDSNTRGPRRHVLEKAPGISGHESLQAGDVCFHLQSLSPKYSSSTGVDLAEMCPQTGIRHFGISHLLFVFWFGVFFPSPTGQCSGLIPALCSGIIPVGLQRSDGVSGIHPGLATCPPSLL